MLLTTFLITLLSAVPTTLSAPASAPADLKDAYQCGYVLILQNSSSFAGLSAYDHCAPFYYNKTLGDYQDAFAYRLWGGCKCSFFLSGEECTEKADVPLYEGPTVAKEDPYFEEPKPKWYNCFRV